MLSVSICIPTRNERENIQVLIPEIIPYGYEIIVVDDSDDDTAEVAEKLGAKVVIGDRKGLAHAILKGIDTSERDAVIVMDADLQHPPEILPQAVEQLKYHDLVVMTKHTKEAMADFSMWRKLQSNLGTWAAHVLIPAPVSDPMTGFFGIRRKCLEDIPRGEYLKYRDDLPEALDDMPEELTEEEVQEWYISKGYAKRLVGIEPIGFKMGLELFTKAKWVSHAEVSIHFKNRQFGLSKGTMNSLQKHLWRLLKNSFEYEVELPKGGEEYHNFYEANDWQRDWKQSIASILQQRTYEIKP